MAANEQDLPDETVATPYLQNMVPALIMDAGFDHLEAFKRALLVFTFTFLRYEYTNVELYRDAIAGYTNQLMNIYDFEDLDIPDTLFIDIDDYVRHENISIRLIVHKYIGRYVDNSTIRISMGVVDQLQEFHHLYELNPAVITQDNIEMAFTTTWWNYLEMIMDEQEIQIDYRDHYWLNDEIRDPTNSNLIDFHLLYRDIHWEGYEQWIDFGEDIQLLVSVRFETFDVNSDPQDVISFQLNSFYLMLMERLTAYREQPNPDAHIHRPITTKTTLTYMQDRIDPNLMDAFWTLPVPQQPECVKYTDLQIGFRPREEVKGEFCICNEFCNLNAFFHYNPMYRFLLVQHNRLYIQNRTNLADIYQFVITYCLVNEEFPDTLVTPLVRLLDSVNDQRVLNWNQSMSDKQFDDNYQMSYPNRIQLLGVTYQLMRNSVPISDICITTNTNPFLDQSFKNIKKYYKVLLDLHLIVLSEPQFVNPNDREAWLEEYEDLSRIHFHNFVCWSYEMAMQTNIRLVSNLFTEDYKYSSYIIKSYEDRLIIESQKEILKPNTDLNGNPINITFELYPFSHCRARIWEYITRFAPKVTRVYRIKTLAIIREFCRELDQKFETTASVENFTQHRVQLAQPLPPVLEPIRTQLFVFYKLKTYFYAFGVQKYFIESAINHSQKLPTDENQAFLEFTHIFRNHWIEDIFQTEYPNQEIQLFDSSFADHRISLSFESFYVNFYRRTAHELQDLTEDEIMVSVIEQYVRLRYWHQNNGDNRLRFTDIITQFSQSLEEVLTNARMIYQNHILFTNPLLKQMYGTDEHYIEVISELVYWLVKASCFMVLKLVSIFLSNIHEQEDNQLVADNKMYLLCKPGFVPLFRTKQIVLEILDKMLTSLIFDDIFDRILKTISETKAMVKQLYKEYYKKLSVDWFDEIGDLYNTEYTQSALVIRLHLISGLSFVVHFINDFRQPSQLIRQKLKYIRSLNNNRNATQLSFNQTWDQCLQFLTQVPEIERAQPFMSPIWAQYCQNDFSQYAQLDHTFDAWIPDSDHL